MPGPPSAAILARKQVSAGCNPAASPPEQGADWASLLGDDRRLTSRRRAVTCRTVAATNIAAAADVAAGAATASEPNYDGLGHLQSRWPPTPQQQQHHEWNANASEFVPQVGGSSGGSSSSSSDPRPQGAVLQQQSSTMQHASEGNTAVLEGASKWMGLLGDGRKLRSRCPPLATVPGATQPRIGEAAGMMAVGDTHSCKVSQTPGRGVGHELSPEHAALRKLMLEGNVFHDKRKLMLESQLFGGQVPLELAGLRTATVDELQQQHQQPEKPVQRPLQQQLQQHVQLQVQQQVQQQQQQQQQASPTVCSDAAMSVPEAAPSGRNYASLLSDGRNLRGRRKICVEETAETCQSLATGPSSQAAHSSGMHDYGTFSGPAAAPDAAQPQVPPALDVGAPPVRRLCAAGAPPVGRWWAAGGQTTGMCRSDQWDRPAIVPAVGPPQLPPAPVPQPLPPGLPSPPTAPKPVASAASCAAADGNTEQLTAESSDEGRRAQSVEEAAETCPSNASAPSSEAPHSTTTTGMHDDGTWSPADVSASGPPQVPPAPCVEQTVGTCHSDATTPSSHAAHSTSGSRGSSGSTSGMHDHGVVSGPAVAPAAGPPQAPPAPAARALPKGLPPPPTAPKPVASAAPPAAADSNRERLAVQSHHGGSRSEDDSVLPWPCGALAEVIEAWCDPEPGFLQLRLGDCIELTHAEWDHQYSGKNLRSKEVGWFPVSKVKMLPGRPQRTVEQAVLVYRGFTEHTYRLVFPFEDNFTPDAPHLFTIVPSGVVENSKVLQPQKEKGLIAFAYPQSIPDEIAGLPVGSSKVDSSTATDGKDQLLRDTAFVWRRQDGTNALVQTWPTALNQKFRQDFEIAEGTNPDSAKFQPQAVSEFQEAMGQLFGPAAAKCPILFCHKKLVSTSPAVAGLGEDVLTHLKEHPDLMHELAIARIDIDGLGFVADGTDGNGQKFEKNFRLTPGEQCVVYRKTGWESMGSIKPLHQFLADAEFHGSPTGPFRSTPGARPLDAVEKKYGEAVKTQLQHVWEHQAYPSRDHKACLFFLQLRESSPQGPECETCEDLEEKHLLDMVSKLILYAPQQWFSIVTGGQACPEGTQNDFKHIGVAFDASNRLRRAGILYYHNELSKMSEAFGHKLVYHIGPGSVAEGAFVDLESAQGLPPKQEGLLRVVAIGCTHQFHDHVHFPPDGGDILIHAGDLGYDESRSLWATEFEKVRDRLLDASAVKAWLEREGVPLGKTLKWLQDVPNFKDKLLVGGNHDFILEQLDTIATELCELYGLSYLRTQDISTVLHNNQIRAWGSGMSAIVTRLVNCARLGTWNQAHGTAAVVDLEVPNSPATASAVVTEPLAKEAKQRKIDQPFDQIDANKEIHESPTLEETVGVDEKPAATLVEEQCKKNVRGSLDATIPAWVRGRMEQELHESPTLEETTGVDEKPAATLVEELDESPTPEETTGVDEKAAAILVEELLESPTVEETTGVDEKPAATLVEELHGMTARIEEKPSAPLVEEDAPCEPSTGSTASDSTEAVEPVPAAALATQTEVASTSDGKTDCVVAASEVTAAHCSDGDDSSSNAAEVDPAETSCEPNAGLAASESTKASEPELAAAAAAAAATALTTQTLPVSLNDENAECVVAAAEVAAANCFESDASSSKATEVGPASGWEKFSDPETSRDWFWNRDTEEWFFAHDHGPWSKFMDECNRAWWWNDQTGAWFYEPAGVS